MNAITDGGPAFPGTPVREGDRWDGVSDGMSLRDYFAAQALIGQLAAFHDPVARGYTVEHARAAGTSAKTQVATAAYEYADAMLQARVIREEPTA